MPRPGSHRTGFRSIRHRLQRIRAINAVHIGDKILRQRVQNTGGEFRNVEVGIVKFDAPGVYKVWINPITVDEEENVMDLKALRISPR